MGERLFQSKTGGCVAEFPWLEPEAVARQLQPSRHWVWLDSATGQGFSYLCAEPLTILDFAADQPVSNIYPALLKVLSPDGDAATTDLIGGDPFADLTNAIALPPFRGGLVGMFSYEAGRIFEQTPDLSPYRLGDHALPRVNMGLYTSVLAFDHANKQVFAMASGAPTASPEQRTIQAVHDLDIWRERIDAARQQSDTMRCPANEPVDVPILPKIIEFASDFSAQTYIAAVKRVIAHICAGDIFQANLSQEFSGTFAADIDGLDLYCRLRHKSPAPYSVYAQFPDWALLSVSPEQFLTINDKSICSRPIKGTAPRASHPPEDQKLADRLQRSEKDRAENIMIVDLLRNDFARICRDHTVRVSELCKLESHSNVHHLVSTINGEPAANQTALDAIAACFPGGSITGAPKIRAMDIIAEIERRPRGPYCGSFGTIGFDGAASFNILIRTIVKSGRHIKFSAGGGITAQSDPEIEYQETLDKAAHIADTLGLDLRETAQVSAE